MQGNYDEFRFFTGLRLSEDRSIRLCPRVVAVLERQLRFRERFVREESITHTCSLLTKAPPIPEVRFPHVRRKRTLKQLPIRYRKPYTAATRLSVGI